MESVTLGLAVDLSDYFACCARDVNLESQPGQVPFPCWQHQFGRNPKVEGAHPSCSKRFSLFDRHVAEKSRASPLVTD